ncbi:DUF6443 domain-containing protein, partial [Flavobacterium salmonis]|uniref:DUF6443 domain-containing protein n=1 Tax=Flavobacterium salmonis TaxID=2654844 RepID=UPI001E52F581
MKKLLYILTGIILPSVALGQTIARNYVKSAAFQVETTTGSVTNDQKIESINYFDGLGRPLQNIAKQAGGNKQDIITPIAYDLFGRQKREYLPYSRASSSLSFADNLMPDSYGNIIALNYFYANKYPDDFAGLSIKEVNPFSEKSLEASPLNKIMKEGAPGAPWRIIKGIDADHSIKFENNANDQNDYVRRFKVSFTAGNRQNPSLEDTGTYASLQLYKTITKNENWVAGKNNTTEEFKDKEGRVVLKRTYANYTDVGGQVIASTISHDTYYVYDVYGNLTYVIPPKGFGTNPGSTSTGSNITSAAVINPGGTLQLTAGISITLLEGFHAQAGSTFSAALQSTPENGLNTIDQDVLDNLCYQYKYDKKNRLIEKKLPGKEWEYIIYDALDRPILTQDANLKASNKWLFTKHDAFGRPVYTGEYVNAVETTRALVQNLADNSAVIFENKTTAAININGTNANYTNAAFPSTGIDLFTITYYDNYLNFDLDQGDAVASYGKTPIINPKGLTTATKIRTLGTSLWTTTVNHYDSKGREIYTHSKNNFLSAVSTVKNNLDFVKVIETTTTHKKGITDIAIVDTFTYDHMGRLLTQKQKINTQPQETIIANTYDDLGQLITKVVGNVQTVNYSYNVRGWLKNINDINNIGTDLFAFQIKYNDVDDSNKKLFNGNISQTLWRTAHTDTSIRSYLYSYDAMNRLTAATDNLGRYNENPTYDKNGNIMRMLRNGNTIPNTPNYGTIDNLAYTYDDGNRLQKVEDSSANIQGFTNGNSAASFDYDYDDNGNMIRDANKGITAISYNHLNLPVQVTLSAGNINYKYDATGTKQRKIVNGITTDYAGGFQYENDNLQFFPNSEGYVRYNAGVYEYIYQYKDHLGNTRLSYSKNLNIIEEDNYYPFGLKQSRHDNVVNTQGNATAQKY